MHNSYKISFSLPKADLEMLENARKRMGLGRSAVIDMAIRFWLDSMQQQELIKRYEEGYRKKPEKTMDLKALEKAGLESMTQEEW